MRLAIVALLCLGLVAALSATVLVSTLLAPQPEPIVVDTEEQVVQIIVAKRALPAMAVVSGSDLATTQVKASQLPEHYLTNAVQAAGKVLIKPMAEGEAFAPAYFASEDSGLHLAAVIPEGMRAMSVSLSDHAGLEGLLYPGSYVDVVVTFKPLDEGGKAMPFVSATLLQGVQVLAIDHRTLISPTGPKDGAALTSQRRRVVSLLVNDEQARTLQLATEHGAISLALRNPLDERLDELAVTSIRDLVRTPGEGISPEAFTAMLTHANQDVIRAMEELMTNGQQPQPRPATGQPTVPPAYTPNPDGAMGMTEPAPAVQQRIDPRYWEAMILRGAQMETRKFEEKEE